MIGPELEAIAAAVAASTPTLTLPHKAGGNGETGPSDVKSTSNSRGQT
jgi:hypothetical protein